jgi:hypothetical protein
MPKAFSDTVAINTDPAYLFALTQDYGRRLAWDPFLRSAELLGAEQPGVGVRALCVAKSGLAMETEYVSFDPPTVCAIRMTRGPWVVAEFAGSWRFREVEPGRTEVRFRYLVVGRPRLLTPLLRAFFARETRRRLLGLKRAVEDAPPHAAGGK